MTKDTLVTAPTRFVEADGIRYTYRRFGSESGTPLVFLQHFRGGLDNWDLRYRDPSSPAAECTSAELSRALAGKIEPDLFQCA